MFPSDCWKERQPRPKDMRKSQEHCSSVIWSSRWRLRKPGGEHFTKMSPPEASKQSKPKRCLSANVCKQKRETFEASLPKPQMKTLLKVQFVSELGCATACHHHRLGSLTREELEPHFPNYTFTHEKSCCCTALLITSQRRPEYLGRNNNGRREERRIPQAIIQSWASSSTIYAGDGKLPFSFSRNKRACTQTTD